MNDVNQQCMSLDDGNLEPDLRVNYQFGLILGVNEFRQEQQYFLEKDYLSNRALHGYGTVSGLRVSATELPASSATNQLNDVQITVEPGIALDQWGRPVVVRNTQCARLRPWLAKQDWFKPDGTEKEAITLYVVASYDSCTDKLAPMPAQPCSSGEDLTAPIRIRDYFNIELRNKEPDMPAWSAVRMFAELLARIRIVAGQSSDDESKIIDELRKLTLPASLSPVGTPVPPPFWYLPAATAQAALNRIFAVWCTEIRPKLAPDLLNPHPGKMTKAEEDASAGVLLARIDFTYIQATKQIILMGQEPDFANNLQRPFLLSTQLIQELFAPVRKDSPVEFATLQVWDAHTVDVWVHHPDVLAIPTSNNGPVDWNTYLLLKSDDNLLTIHEVTRLRPEGAEPAPVQASGTVLRITTQPDTPVEAGAKIDLTFKLENFPMQDGSTLLESVKKSPLEYIGQDWVSQAITVYAVVDVVPRPRELVTINTVVPVHGTPYLSLKFQTDQRVKLSPNEPKEKTIQIQRRQWNDENEELTFSLDAITDGNQDFSFYWNVRPPEDTLHDKDFLYCTFDTDLIHVGDETKTLTSIIREQHIPFVGYDGDHTIRVFYEVAIPPPIREFATLHVWDGYALNAWIHHPEQVLPPVGSPYPLKLKSDGKDLNIVDVKASREVLAPDTLLEIFTNDPMMPEARIELTFQLSGFSLQNGENLEDSIAAHGLEYVGHNHADGTVTVHTLVEEIQASRELVTISTVVPTEGTPYLSLKFQTDYPVQLPADIQVRWRKWDTDEEEIAFQTRYAGDIPGNGFSFYWDLLPPDGKQLNDRDFLTINFNPTEIQIQRHGVQQPLAILIQERFLLFAGYRRIDSIYVFYEVTIPRLVREFATLQIRDAHTIDVWIHHPDLLGIPTAGGAVTWGDYLVLKGDDTPLTIDNVTPSQTQEPGTMLRIAVQPTTPIVVGAKVALTFKLAGFPMEGGGVSLLGSIERSHFTYVGHDRASGTITVYTIAEEIPVLRELVTISTVLGLDGSVSNLSLRFNVEGEVRLPPTIVAQRENDQRTITFDVTRQGTVPSLHWDLKPQQVLKDKDRLSFTFNINGEANPNGISVDTRTLADIIREQHLLFVGYDGNQTISAFYEVNAPPQQQSGPSIDEIITKVLTMPTQPFVTITPLVISQERAQFELWFHLNLNPESNEAYIQELMLRVYAEEGGATFKPIELASLNPSPSPKFRNVFTVELEPHSWQDAREARQFLRFVFPTGKIRVIWEEVQGGALLTEYIFNSGRQIKFEGYNGRGNYEEAIIAYVRLDLQRLL